MSAAGIPSILSSQGSPASIIDQVRPGRVYAQELSQALQSGDLAGAQQAYQQLAAYSQSHPGPLENNPQIAHDFAAVGQALQNGDLTGAQQAFATLQGAIRSGSTGGGGGGGTATPDIVINLSDQAATAVANAATNATNSAATPASTTYTPASGQPAAIELTISGGNGSSPITLNIDEAAGEQLAINIANTSNGEQVTLQLGSGSNAPEIQLNFAGATAPTSTGSQTAPLNVTA